MTNHDDIHTCSYQCDRPACIRRQRDDLVRAMEQAGARIRELEDERRIVTARINAMAERLRRFLLPEEL